MSTVEARVGEFKDPGSGMPGAAVAAPPGGGVAGDGLVLPAEVVADLAGQLVARARAGEPVRLTGAGGLLAGVIGQVLQAGLALELEEHLAAGGEGGNGRNGYRAKTVKTEAGPVMVSVPRDRAGTFEPVLVARGERRTSGISDTVISLYASGMSVRDIARHCQRAMGIEVSHDTVSKITDEVLEEVRAWQARPLEQVYPVLYVDALVAKVRDGSGVRNKAVNIAVGIDCEGVKHVLGIWVAAAEGAKAWAQALAQMRNRGLEDVIICCCDGLAGLGEEITAAWPEATVQSCVVHLIRAAARYGSYTDRKALCAAMRPVYTAADMDAAGAALLEFADSALGKKYPAAAGVWERAWDRFVPFLEFAPPIRKVIYTTNAIESFNRQMRKIIKTRGHFPNDDALVKLLWLGIVDIEDRRAAERARQASLPKNARNAAGHLIEGAMTPGWREALAAFDAKWPGRIPVTAMSAARPLTGEAMTRLPVTLADQGIFIDPDDADELIDLLSGAAWVIGHLASHPAAEDACAHAPARPGTCTELAIDLRLAAAGLDEAATAGQENTYMTAHARKGAGTSGKHPQHAPENQHSEEGK